VIFANPADLAWEAYLAGDFDTVEYIVSTAISDSTLSVQDQARLYLALGCSDAIQGRDRTASAAFERSLILDPDNKLTSADIPPPVWLLYEPVLKRYIKANRESTVIEDLLGNGQEPVQVDSVVSYIGVTHSRNAVLKSLVFPGWGHYSEGRARWKIFAGTQGVLLSGFAVALYERDRARDKYMREVYQPNMASAYDRYNRAHRASYGLGAALVVNYLVAQWDFFTVPPPMTIKANGLSTGGMQIKMTYAFQP
jgi:hypothetical protein